MKVYNSEKKQYRDYSAEDYIDEYDNPKYYDESVKDYGDRLIRFINYLAIF